MITLGMLGGGGGIPPFSYRNTYVDAVNRNTYNFVGCDLGTPHALRMDIIFVWSDSQVADSVTVDGVAATLVGAIAGPNRRASIWRAAATANPTGQIDVAFGSAATKCVIHVWAGYPASQTPVFGSDDGAVNVLSVLNLAKTAGGFTVYGTCHHDAATCVVTQTGAETIIEDYDAVTEVMGVSGGHHINTATTSTDDYTATASGVGTDAFGFLIASWGP